jgi:hypothetical protein
MEDPDTDDTGDEIGESRTDELEQRLKELKRVIKNINVIGPGMSGDVDAGFDYQP